MSLGRILVLSALLVASQDRNWYGWLIAFSVLSFIGGTVFGMFLMKVLA